MCRALFRALYDGTAPPGATPDSLAVFFERSLERKPSGAYYTQADVAGYIARATLIPALIERAAALRPQSFGPQGALWEALARHPERFIHADVRHGHARLLPDEVAAGLTDVTRRARWDTLAPGSHALAHETWREVVARRRRYDELRTQLARGELRAPADLISANLDLAQVALAAVESCDADGLRALWAALTELRVLDPTCGAGAFLLEAARALEPLYRACLERMAALGGAHADMAGTAAQLAEGPGRAANVLAAILAHNLHGVDLMPEAVAVCRMRLALEVWERAGQHVCPEALTNIVAGDALLGLDWQAAFPAVMRQGGFDAVVGNPPYVAVIGDERLAYRACGYRTAACGNLYALVVERALGLLREGGRLGVVVPVASLATGAMAALQDLYAPLEQWHSHYAVRPARLFDGVDMNLTISLARKGPGARHSAGYRRWTGGAGGGRRHLFTTLAYAPMPELAGHASRTPKLGERIEARVLEQMRAHGRALGDYVTSDGTPIYYHSGGRYWRKALPEKLSSHYKPVRLPAALAPAALCLLNSQLFYWYWITHSNCMDLVAREVLGLPVFALERADPAPFEALARQALAAYAEGRRTRVRRGARIRVAEANFDVARARPVIDAIDALLAQHYGLDDEALDFVRSYDIKHRAGLLRRATPE